MRKYFNKLVRDRIPEIIQAEGRTFQLETLDNGAYLAALMQKLIEEAEELAAASPEKRKEELADILEVLDAIVVTLDYDRVEILAEQRRRRAERGSFFERIKLLWVE
ncbi:MAG: nucleoside triphosphate pyrophosphohydrolase [Truepera sp.]|nr:nucleoside triphosphate pyrophosphohydrolase [Truepera sp.]